MTRDFEDLHDIENLSDAELRDLAHRHLADSRALDVADVTVTAFEGAVRLTGRVGTDQELRIAERLLTDGLGIERVVNELVVDTNRRAESPEAIDEHLVDEAEVEGLLLGDRALSISPEAEHLANLESDEIGTHDVGRAIADGTPWIPPDGPTPEGFSEGDADRGESSAR